MEHQLFTLAKAFSWSPNEIRALPWARRQRAVKWINFTSAYEKEAMKSKAEIQFDTEGLIDVVWRAPPNSGFGV